MHLKFNSPRGIALRFALGIFAILGVVFLTGMAGYNPALPLAVDTPTITPTLTATPAPSSWLGHFLQPTDPASQTLGIIITGGVIVLVILGGTFTATRRKY